MAKNETMDYAYLIALVAIVAVVALVCITLIIIRLEPESVSILKSEENSVGQAGYPSYRQEKEPYSEEIRQGIGQPAFPQPLNHE